MRNVVVLTFAVLVGACAAPATQTSGKVTSDSERCSVYVYRTQTAFHSLNPEKPFVFVGEEQVGTLGVGDSLCLRLPTGKYTVSVREAFLFMPAWTSGSVEVEVVPEVTAYVRYSKDFGGVAPSAAGPVVTGKTRLGLSNEQSWKARQ